MPLYFVSGVKGIIEGGTVVDKVVANIDIAPTIMQTMGLKMPPHMDGQSFLTQKLQENLPPSRHLDFEDSVFLFRGLPMNLRKRCLLCATLVTTLGMIWMVGLTLQAGHAVSATGVGSVYAANVQQETG